MLRIHIVAIGITFGAVLLAQAQKPADEIAIDPVKASADFAIQGEYAGMLDKDLFGAEVIARGAGNFVVNFLPGGLRGEGGDYTRRIEGTAKTENNKVTVTSKDGKWSATIADGKLIGKNPDGKEFTLKRVVRESKTLGEKPPEGAIILYGGPSDVENWTNSKVVAEHLVGNETTTKRAFRDMKIHLEFRLSFMPGKTGQSRSNSGVKIQKNYEVQVLDSFGLKGANNECGGLYGRKDPRVNMCYPPLQWQTFDIEFRCAKLDKDGKKASEATISVWHNGVLVHDKVEIKDHKGDAGPLHLQNHSGQVQYRNIWVVELDKPKEK